MDPNETLKRILAICEAMQTDPHSEDELAQLITALDAWIVRRGFLPERWRPRPAILPRYGVAVVLNRPGTPRLFAEESRRDTAERIAWAIKPEQENLVRVHDEVLIRIDDEQDPFCHILTVNP